MIADRLYIPTNTKAILWDMDGVLLDTLGLDMTICNELLHQYFGNHVNLTKDFIRSIFAYHSPEFWQIIFEFIKNEYNISGTENDYNQILKTYDQARNDHVFEINPGIIEILESARKIPLKIAVVSNNLTAEVKTILSRSGIPLDMFDFIVGNDIKDLKKKSAPDTYLFATQMLKVDPGQCVVVEDSLVGAEAGKNAGCFTVGVATGGTDFEPLEKSQFTDRVYSSFHPKRLSMHPGKVTNKNIFTPNEFVSHMVEHIAWRTCCEIDLHWNNNDWFLLGKNIGAQVKTFDVRQNSGAALGMIDDGSAEVFIELSDKPGMEIGSTKLVDLDWFLSLRCEQICSGEPLTELIKGMADGLGAKINITVCSLEDPHHTWEGIFRSIGIVLNKMFIPEPAQSEFEHCEIEKNVSQGDISVIARSLNYAEVSRKTAESSVSVIVDFSKQEPARCCFNVSSTINVSGLEKLIKLFAEQGGFTVQVDYNATVLSSSHVVLEDTALVLGRALKEILVLRMEHCGANGAGSSIDSADDLKNQPIRVGISVEGRKFWKFVPFEDSFDDLRKKFIIGQKVCDDLFSEDLDDFTDGLSGGLNCSTVVHIKEMVSPDQGWQMIFKNLGKALKEVFAVNPYRKGVPPGVKATLA
ncbi:MAG: HAD-IA family hydrolase [Desulfobacterales bacterium]|nr:HAD-IA family hydrolase [Desulfobacterales bacterium]